MAPNTPTTHDVIRKIQKLLAKGSDSRLSGGEAEAASYMEMAQSLLAKYNLDFAMVQDAAVEGGTVAPPPEAREKTRVSRSAQYRWQRDIWKAIAEANFCWHSIVEVFDGKRGKGTSKVRVKRHMILGTTSNVAAVRLMGEYLEDTMERILPFANRERLSRSAISWKSGCADRLIERIRAQAEDRKQAGDAGAGCTGLVLRSVYDREYAANYDVVHGTGMWAQRQIRDAEWEAGQEQRDREAAEYREKAEKARLEFLANESPADKAKREKREQAERIKEARASSRYSRSWNRQRREEASKVDREAYRSGSTAGNSINIGKQVPAAAKGTERKGIE